MKKFIVFISSVIIAISCDNHSDEKIAKAESVDSAEISVVSNQNEIDVEEDNQVTLPSPLRIATTFKRSGLKFIDGSLNPAENANLYTSTYTKALNLGVYSADMAYCLLNKQYATSKNYLKTCKEVGEQLGLNSAFEANDLAKRFESNMGKDDSLMKLVSDLQMQTDLVLEQSKQTHVSALMFTGAWIETIHSASQVYMKGEAKMAPVILEQFTLINDVIKVLNIQKEKDTSIAVLIADLEFIKTEFYAIEALKNVDLEEVDFTTLKLNANDLSALCEKTEALRDKIIKG